MTINLPSVKEVEKEWSSSDSFKEDSDFSSPPNEKSDDHISQQNIPLD